MSIDAQVINRHIKIKAICFKINLSDHEKIGKNNF